MTYWIIEAFHLAKIGRGRPDLVILSLSFRWDDNTTDGNMQMSCIWSSITACICFYSFSFYLYVCMLFLRVRPLRWNMIIWCLIYLLGFSQVQDPNLTGVSHLLVDEIHERGMYEDFLLIILKDLLPRRPDLRLILMSATINAELFSKYFGNAPTIHIPVLTISIFFIAWFWNIYIYGCLDFYSV